MHYNLEKNNLANKYSLLKSRFNEKEKAKLEKNIYL